MPRTVRSWGLQISYASTDRLGAHRVVLVKSSQYTKADRNWEDFRLSGTSGVSSMTTYVWEIAWCWVANVPADWGGLAVRSDVYRH